MAMNTARDRAEELLQNLQKRARELLDAEEGLVKTVRDLVEESGVTPVEVKRRLEDLLGRIKANKVWDRLRTNDKVVALSDYRDELEKRLEASIHSVLGSLQIASKADVDALKAQLEALQSSVGATKKPAAEP